jgi:hypothetical protein
MKKNFIILFIAFFALRFFAFAPTAAVAADISSIGIATYLNVNGNHIENGDVVIATAKGYLLSTNAYDPQVFGVVTDKPAIVLKSDAQQKGYPVITSGVAYVKVVGQNGNIKKGEFIATSAVTGAGMRATQNSYVLGEALDSATFANSKEVKLIPVNMNLHYLQVSAPLKSSLLDIFTLSKIASYEQPTRVVQYIMAAIIAIMSFAFGFVIFARAINTGLEALGRNPLAGRMIQLSIIFNVVLVMIIIMTGIFLVYLVLHL